MNISKFFHYLQINNDIYAIFNSLTMKILFVDKPFLDQIISGTISNSSQVKILLENNILVESTSDDYNALRELKRSIKNTTGVVSLMYLNITTKCNLLCEYCFIEQATQSQNRVMRMSTNTARVAIDKFVEEIDAKNDGLGEIIIYGGEPTLNRKVLMDSISYARARKPDLKISIVTNGTLLDEKLVKFLSENLIGVGLSLDGPKPINDKNRVFKNSQLSVYDVVERNIELMNEHSIRYSLSATVSKDVIENKEQVFSWLKNSDIKNVFWNILHFSSYTDSWGDFYENMADFMIESYDKLLEYKIGEGKLNEHLDLFINNHFRFHSCGAVGLNQITIQPNGNICICQGDSRTDDHTVGNILRDNISHVVQNETENYWKKLYTVDNDTCIACPALYVCGGGCPLQSEILFGKREVLDEASCIFYKKLLHFIIEKFYFASIDAKQGGV